MANAEAVEAAKSSSRLYNFLLSAIATFTDIPNMHLYLTVYSPFIGPQDGVKMETEWEKKFLLSQSINKSKMIMKNELVIIGTISIIVMDSYSQLLNQ